MHYVSYLFKGAANSKYTVHNSKLSLPSVHQRSMGSCFLVSHSNKLKSNGIDFKTWIKEGGVPSSNWKLVPNHDRVNTIPSLSPCQELKRVSLAELHSVLLLVTRFSTPKPLNDPFNAQNNPLRWRGCGLAGCQATTASFGALTSGHGARPAPKRSLW